MNKNLILLGMMGVGKTSLGKIVAKRKSLKFVDTDTVVETKNKMTVREIFKKKGEEFFRMEEKKEILKILDNQNCIIALGGGAFMDADVRKNIIKKDISVWLDLDIKILADRTKKSRTTPLLKNVNNEEKIKEIYFKRKNIYKLAKHRISCNNLNKEDIVEKIIEIYDKQQNNS